MDSNTHPNYELFEELGASPVSSVIRAFDRRLERYVAIKVLSADTSADPSRRQRFFQEARFLANLAHPNVLPVYALEEAQRWMVMELMAASMKDRLNSGPLSAEIAKSVLAQSFEALKYIHGLGRVHASIRPSNILISDTGMVKLSDFSDRRPEDGLDAPAPELSKYVPPEVWKQAQFGPIGTTLDFYSLGITIVECLAGKPLELLATGFNRQNSPDIEWARWHTSPEHEKAVAELLKSVPKGLRPVVESMLKQKAGDRSQSADQLISLLGATKLVAVDIPLEAAPGVEKTAMPAAATSPFTTPSSEAKASPFERPTEKPRPAPLLQQPQKATTSKSPKSTTKSGFDLNNPKTFRIVAIVTLGLAGIFGLFLQGILSPSIPRTPVVLNVEPAAANLTINGKAVKLESGRAELNLDPGEYTLKAALDGYDPVEEKIKIEQPKEGEKTEPIKKSIPLQESKVGIALEFDPPDAILLVDGKEPEWSSSKETNQKAEQLLLLRPGKYEFKFQKDGYVATSTEKTVTQSTKQLKFDPLLIEFAVQVQPVEATIVLADAKPIEGKKNVFAVSQGKRQLKAAHPGFEPKSEVIEVSADKRIHEVVLTPTLVQFEMKLPVPEIQIACDGKSLQPNSDSKYELRPGEYTIAFSIAKSATETTEGLWEQRIKVEPNMLPVDVKLPEEIAKKMASIVPKNGATPNSSKSMLKDVVVRLYPTSVPNVKLVLGGNPIELSNGEATVPYADLGSDRKAIELRVLRDNKTVFEEFVTRESLEAQGETAVINHSVALTDTERARRLWLFARTAVKSFPKEAIEALDEALKLDPALAEAYRERAIAKNELDLVSEAEEDVVKALNDLPNDYSTLSVGGIVASKMFLKTSGAAEKANLSLATSRLNQAIERYPKRTSARMMRSQLHYWAGDKKAAEEDLVALLGLTREPDQLSYVKSQLGTIATDAGKIDLAMQLFDEAIAIRKSAEISTTVPQFNKAKAVLEHARRTQKEDPNKARKFFELAKSELLVLDGRKDLATPEFLAMLAEIEATLGNYKAAIKFYTDLINNGVVTPIILRNRAAAFEAVGNKKLAEEDRAKASQLGK